MHNLFRGGLARVAIVLALAGPFVASDAFAQSDAETAQKILLHLQGANADFEKGQFDRAYEGYRKAYALYPDNALLYRMGLSAEKAKRYRTAVEHYEDYVAKAPDTPTAKELETHIPEVRGMIPPRVRIASVPTGAEVLLGAVDGQKLGVTPLELDLPQGEVTVYLLREGYRASKEVLQLKNGEDRDINVKMVDLTGLGGDEDPNGTEDPGMDAETSATLRMWGWIGAGTGVALIGTGVALNMLSQSGATKANEYDKRAPDASRQELADIKANAESTYRAALGAYVAGGVFAAAGGVLLLAGGAFSGGGEADAEAEPTVRLDVQVMPGGGLVGLNGTF